MQQNAYHACLQSAVAEINRRVDSFMRETTTAPTELRISLQYTQTQVEELKVNQSKENIDETSQDSRRQVQIVQGPRAGATGGEEESASRHLCE